MTYLLKKPDPPKPPPKPFLGGVSWNPRAQLEAYQLRPSFEVLIDNTEFVPMLGDNPSRLAWYAQAQDSVGSQAPTLMFSPWPNVSFGALLADDTTMPYRCHCAEWPGLCQSAWWAFSPTGLLIVNVWEIVMI